MWLNGSRLLHPPCVFYDSDVHSSMCQSVGSKCLQASTSKVCQIASAICCEVRTGFIEAGDSMVPRMPGDCRLWLNEVPLL
jgi:hypothetical protein